MGNVDYWMGFLAWLNTWSNSLRCFSQRAISDSPSKWRMGTGRHWERNWLWRKRRSKEHRQREKGGDELSLPSTDSKSHLLTKNCIFTVILIHIRDGFTHLLTLFSCLVVNQFPFHARTRRKHWTCNNLWYYSEYKTANSYVCIVVVFNGQPLRWNMILNVFLFKILLLGE